MLKEKFYNFMRGRYAALYGLDALSKFLFAFAIILSIVPIFIRNDYTRLVSNFALVAFGYIYFRLLSTNISKRYAKNQRFLAATSSVRRPFVRLLRNVKDRDYKYITCENCTQELRVPRNKGKIQVTCKSCKHKFQVRT